MAHFNYYLRDETPVISMGRPGRLHLDVTLDNKSEISEVKIEGK